MCRRADTTKQTARRKEQYVPKPPRVGKNPELNARRREALRADPAAWRRLQGATYAYDTARRTRDEQLLPRAREERAAAERAALKADPEKHAAYLAAAQAAQAPKREQALRNGTAWWQSEKELAKSRERWARDSADPGKLAARRARKLARYHARMADDRYLIERRLRARLRGVVRRGTSPCVSKRYGIDWQKVLDHLGPCPGDLRDWHVDHIRPVCSFDLLDDDQVRLAFAPENHQWLPREENLRKSREDVKLSRKKAA